MHSYFVHITKNPRFEICGTRQICNLLLSFENNIYHLLKAQFAKSHLHSYIQSAFIHYIIKSSSPKKVGILIIPNSVMSKLRFREVIKYPVQGHTNVGAWKELLNYTKANPQGI